MPGLPLISAFGLDQPVIHSGMRVDMEGEFLDPLRDVLITVNLDKNELSFFNFKFIAVLFRTLQCFGNLT